MLTRISNPVQQARGMFPSEGDLNCQMQRDTPGSKLIIQGLLDPAFPPPCWRASPGFGPLKGKPGLDGHSISHSISRPRLQGSPWKPLGLVEVNDLIPRAAASFLLGSREVLWQISGHSEPVPSRKPSAAVQTSWDGRSGLVDPFCLRMPEKGRLKRKAKGTHKLVRQKKESVFLAGLG